MAKQVFVYLPPPYEDELLYSVVARYCSQAHQRVHKLSCILFGKCFLILRADLPCSLATVAARTKYCWGLTAEAILKRLTLFPYYEPFLPILARETRKQALISGWCRCVIGARAYRVKPPVFLRLCEQCREKDQQQFAETYWRRVHQLPGVLVCPDHGTPLLSTSVHIQPRRTECIDASTARTAQAEPLQALNPHLLQKIARRCRDILAGKKLMWREDFSPQAYRDAALERGLYKLPGIYSPTVFLEQFVNYYGIQLLEKLGVVSKGTGLTWLSCIFQNNCKRSIHPIEHILVQIFLESLPKVSTAHPFGKGPWMCPNPYGTHTVEFPIERIALRSRTDNTYYGRAKCSCGFTFTTYGIDDSTPRMPVVDKVWSFGNTRFNFAQDLQKAGSTLNETAAVLGVSTSHLKTILMPCTPEIDGVQERILEARKAWVELLSEDPRRRVTVARKKRYGLYQFLRRHDKNWLVEQKGKKKLKVDWQKRDLEWSALITDTATRLGDGAPKTMVAREAGLNLRVFNQLNRLPLCAKAFQNIGPSRH